MSSQVSAGSPPRSSAPPERKQKLEEAARLMPPPRDLPPPPPVVPRFCYLCEKELADVCQPCQALLDANDHLPEKEQHDVLCHAVQCRECRRGFHYHCITQRVIDDEERHDCPVIVPRVHRCILRQMRPGNDEMATHSTNTSFVPTAEELDNISRALQRVWDLGVEEVVPNVHYALQLGEMKPDLFAFVSAELMKRPVYSELMQLLEIYGTGKVIKWQASPDELQAEFAFVYALCQTGAFAYLKNFISEKGNPIEDDTFSQLIHNTWFKRFKRDRKWTSPFIHLYVGELGFNKEGKRELKGLHSWLKVRREECLQKMDYQAFSLPPISTPIPLQNNKVVKLNFEWEGCPKESHMFLGVHPAVEAAMFTMVFLYGEEDNVVDLEQYGTINIKCHKYGEDDEFLGTIYPRW